MSLLDDLKAKSPAFATMSNQEIADYIHETYAPTWNKEDVYSRLGYVQPTNPNPLLKALPHGIESGFRQAQIGTNVALHSLGLQGEEATAKRISELTRRQAEIAPTGATKEGVDAIRKAGESGDWGEALSTIAENPRALGRLLLESAGAFIPDIALAVAGGGVAGIAAKALAARLGASALSAEAIGIASKVGAQAVAVGGGSGKTEYGAEFLEALDAAGVDLTSSSAVRAAFKDEELMARARAEGLAKGIPIGIFDGISMGLAGKFYSKIAGATLGSKLAGSAAEAGMQSALGMAGEASGQILQKGQITNVADILLEGILEVATAGPEAALNLRNNKQYQDRLATVNASLDAEKPTTHYFTPGGELSSPLVDQMIDKEAVNNPAIDKIKLSDMAPEEKRLAALQEIFGKDSVEVATTPEEKAQVEQAKALTEPERTPSPTSSLAQEETHKRNYESSLRADLEDAERVLAELGPATLETPIGAQIFDLRSKVRDLDTPAAGKQYDYGFPGSEEFTSTPTEAATPSSELPQEEIAPADPVQPPLQKSVDRFLNSLEQGKVINVAALQGSVAADLGTTPTLTEVKAALESSPVVKRNKAGSYIRAPGSYQSAAQPVRSANLPPKEKIPAGRVTEDRLNLSPSATPPGVEKANWVKASLFARGLPTGKALTPKSLASLGIPTEQIPPIMKEFRAADVVSKGAVPKRTTTEVKMPNTLSEERATKLLKDELTGKTYGC